MYAFILFIMRASSHEPIRNETNYPIFICFNFDAIHKTPHLIVIKVSRVSPTCFSMLAVYPALRIKIKRSTGSAPAFLNILKKEAHEINLKGQPVKFIPRMYFNS